MVNEAFKWKNNMPTIRIVTDTSLTPPDPWGSAITDNGARSLQSTVTNVENNPANAPNPPEYKTRSNIEKDKKLNLKLTYTLLDLNLKETSEEVYKLIEHHELTLYKLISNGYISDLFNNIKYLTWMMNDLYKSNPEDEELIKLRENCNKLFNDIIAKIVVEPHAEIYEINNITSPNEEFDLILTYELINQIFTHEIFDLMLKVTSEQVYKLITAPGATPDNLRSNPQAGNLFYQVNRLGKVIKVLCKGNPDEKLKEFREVCKKLINDIREKINMKPKEL